MPLKPAPTPKATTDFLAGIDIGGTYVKLGLLDAAGKVLISGQIPTASFRGPDQAVRQIVDWLHSNVEARNKELDALRAIGIGSPGPLDSKRGVIISPSNLPDWWDFPIRDKIAMASGVDEVYLTNDANAAAYGEFWVGSGADYSSLLLLTLGTGVGGGIILDGISLEGSNCLAAEVGHITIDSGADSRLCGCGQRGHLEAYASATALVARTREAISSGANSTLAKCHTQPGFDTRTIYQHAQQGDELSLDMIEQTAAYLARGIADIMHVIDPALVVLGGAMTFGGQGSDIGKRFIESVARGVRQATFPAIADNLKIVYSSLGNDAGFIGAAGLAARRMNTHF